MVGTVVWSASAVTLDHLHSTSMESAPAQLPLSIRLCSFWLATLHFGARSASTSKARHQFIDNARCRAQTPRGPHPAFINTRPGNCPHTPHPLVIVSPSTIHLPPSTIHINTIHLVSYTSTPLTRPTHAPPPRRARRFPCADDGARPPRSQLRSLRRVCLLRRLPAADSRLPSHKGDQFDAIIVGAGFVSSSCPPFF